MIYIFEDGRQIYDKTLLKETDEGKYLETQALPTISTIEGKVGYCYANLIENKIEIAYYDIAPEPPKPEPAYKIEELRQQAYEISTQKLDSTNLIEYRNTIYTCDNAYKQLAVYEEEDKYTEGKKSEELGKMWVEAKDYIRNLDIEELKQLLNL